MAPTPKNIRSHKESRELEIEWPDGTVHRLPFRFLRGQCPCAGCVSEDTGLRIIDVNSIVEDIQPTNIGFSGNYALKITWNDQHDSGIYTWEYLQKLGEVHRASTTDD